MAAPGSVNKFARILQAAWLRPLLFLVLLIVGWDLAIRVFHIPPYHTGPQGRVMKRLRPSGATLA